MLIYKNLIIIGTSHIAIESIKEVEAVLLEKKPKIIALELDKKRFYILSKGLKREIKFSDIKKFGFKGWLLGIIGAWLERKLGKLVGTTPGSEMKKAIETAAKINAEIVLIDQDIKTTLNKLSRELTQKEKLRFLIDIFKSIFIRTKIKFDLRKVPDEKIINELIDKVKNRYPSFYKILIKERDEVMAKNIYRIMLNTNKQIVAIVGAGHESAIINKIKLYEKNKI